ncbi:ABC transporter substrate-binding protein [Acetobacterium wieringae]|jgi:iron complex transport system substrate-binding protein|uniref:ABC transporter substrate-binding protein n=1 Tax=Acetobacterium wieringae TaxID=52694 RepID=A0ABY6HIC2_9FIRM|nr:MULTISPECIES: ABC transporter substrate-binding protein [Acetobacterium]URN84844.1 ABC transporter substrate-binding protein [Acetobacterium wieringae]UYO63331.1 ABC transporter substrate-binding protein [Acetobacterium wieringae]VUZ24061.1 Vitamin B12-binding protein [Acetobacterium wieringae]
MKKKSMRNWLVILAVIALMVSFTGCQPGKTTADESGVETKSGSTTYPVTVTDNAGNSVTIEKEPQKIVSLSPATTEILFALDQGDKVVGRTKYCDYPEAALAVTDIGSFNAPTLEKIIELAPDIVVASDFVSDDIKQQLEATGAKVITFNAANIDGVLANIVQAGEVTNANDKATEIVKKMQADREALIEKAKTAKTQKSVFFDIGKFYTAGPGSTLDSMLTDLNAVNIAADGAEQWPQLSTEEIIADNPDVYISLYTKPEDVKATAGFDKINAIINDQLIYFEYLTPESDMIQRPGPRIIEGMALIAESIYPEIFTK